MKKIVLIVGILCTTFSFSSVAGEKGINTGGGGSVSAVLTDINGGGGTGRISNEDSQTQGIIQLLKLERIVGTSKFELRDARPTLDSIVNGSKRPEMVAKMMKLKIMADFKDISEITLKDGTVIKSEELLLGK